MKEGPSIAPVAALAGDPARANMLAALLAGKALTASELANEAGVTVQTASSHLSKLETGGLISGVKQGRHRYFRLADSDVADMLETMMGVAARAGHLRTRTGPADPALRRARVCYDHLAGQRGVALFDGLATFRSRGRAKRSQKNSASMSKALARNDGLFAKPASTGACAARIWRVDWALRCSIVSMISIGPRACATAAS
jgi:DNA-binding transcriptional ArsR family regulator